MDDKSDAKDDSCNVDGDTNIFPTHQTEEIKLQALVGDTNKGKNENSTSIKANEDKKPISTDVGGPDAGDKKGNEDNNNIGDNNTWRCACSKHRFLPPGLLKSFGGVEAMARVGTGQCYHKI